MRLVPASGKAAGLAVDKSIVRISVGSVVEYEQHGAPLIGVVTAEKKGKWAVQNVKGAQLDLAPDRLYLLPGGPVIEGKPEEVSSSQARINYLEKLEAKIGKVADEVNLEELWNLLNGEKAEASSKELAELALGENSLVNHAAIRRALLADTVFFKRSKVNFSLRSPELVEELKAKRDLELKAARERESLRDALVQRIIQSSTTIPLPENILLLEEFAAFGKSAPNSKEALALLEEVEQKTRISPVGNGQERAFTLLVKAGHFHPEEDLNFLRLGRPRVFHSNVMAEIDRLLADIPLEVGDRVDLRDLDTFTIDGAQTKDRDDALSLEETENGWRVGIHIADITPWLNASVLLEHQARTRATSIYTPDYNIPMLPENLSEEFFSLLPGEDRLAISFFAHFDENGEITRREVARSILRIHKHMSYPEADAVLFGEKPGDPYEAPLAKLWEISLVRERIRLDKGALQFSQREMYAKLHPDGKITLEEALEDTPGHKLIGEMMILANETAALFAESQGVPMIFRSQEAPDTNLEDHGLEIPQGPARDFYRRSLLKRSAISSSPGIHSGLGLDCYLQVTSPIRRYVDLVNERQLIYFLETGKMLLSAADMEDVIEVVRKGLDEASLIQRERNRFWLMKYLEQQGSEILEGIIMKTDGPKPLVELDEIFLLAPFHVAGPKDPDTLRARRGHRVRLRVEQLVPRKDNLVLREVAEDEQQ